MGYESQKPGGRTLGEFRPLAPAEDELWARAASGEEARIGSTARPAPDGATRNNTIRASFIRFLALGGDADAVVHAAGVQVRGAWIRGMLDLANGQKIGALVLRNCHFEQELDLTNAEVAALCLEGSRIPKLSASSARVRGSVLLNNGFLSEGEVDLVVASIGGDLICTNGRFENADVSAIDGTTGVAAGDSIIMDKAEVKGGVCFNATKADDEATPQGFSATGIVRLDGASIGDNLDCDGGSFARTKSDPPGADDLPDALSFDGATIKGDVFLRDGFRASGLVSGRAATIGGNLECINALIDVSGLTGAAAQDAEERPVALRLDGAAIKSTLRLERLMVGRCRLSLRSATAGVLDAVDCDGLEQADLRLNGLKYSHLEGRTRITGSRVVTWLDRQGAEDVDAFSLGQPWEQAIKVLRDMGHFEDGRLVAIARQDRMRRTGAVALLARPFHRAYGALAGYGHRPMRVFLIMAAIWLLCGAFYALMAERGVFAPPAASKDTRSACAPAASSPSGWYACGDLPPGHTMFQPFLYSLEFSLPLLDFGQRKAWAPIVEPPVPHEPSLTLAENLEDDLSRLIDPRAWSLGHLTRLITWLQLLAGWIGGGVIVAMVAGLAKRREE